MNGTRMIRRYVRSTIERTRISGNLGLICLRDLMLSVPLREVYLGVGGTDGGLSARDVRLRVDVYSVGFFSRATFRAVDDSASCFVASRRSSEASSSRRV